MGDLTPASRETFSGLVESTLNADECGTSSPGSRVRSRPLGISFAEGPMEISDDSDFDDYEDSDESSDLGLGEELGAMLDYLRAHRDRVARRHL